MLIILIITVVKTATMTFLPADDVHLGSFLQTRLDNH